MVNNETYYDEIRRMFVQNSRYFKVENTAKPDANGRVFESKALRLLPSVSGQFQHILEDSDRLDNLAYKYYKKPRQWWRLCDANPEFISPRSLLGNEPIRVIRFEVQWDGLQAPWHELRQAMMTLVGVESALLGTEDQPYPDEEVFDLGLMFAIAPALQPEITASIMIQQLAAPLDLALKAEGLTLANDIRIEEISMTHWQLNELATKAIYTFRLEEGALNVYESAVRFNWSITVRYNKKNISSDQLSIEIESIPGFIAIAPTQLGRVGKPIIIPPGSKGI